MRGDTDLRKRRSYRFSEETARLIERLVEKLTARDGVRRVTATEVIERSLHQFAQRQGIKE